MVNICCFEAFSLNEMKDRHYVNHNDQVLVVSEKHMEEKRELQFVSKSTAVNNNAMTCNVFETALTLPECWNSLINLMQHSIMYSINYTN